MPPAATMKQLQFAWPNGAVGAVTTSWDDGTCHDRRLVAILNAGGLKGTWNLNARRMLSEPTEKVVQFDEAAKLFAGHEIACHSYSHPWLTQQPDEAVLAEMIADRRILEAAAGYPVRGMSLPFGAYDSRVLRLLRACGIVHNRTTRAHQGFAVPEDFVEWHPTCHHKADLPALWQRFRDARDAAKLFYLWGHSYEFDRDQNWGVLEAFSQTAGAAKDVWHATNMDIYLYVSAWRGLWCALEFGAVRNPSAVTVWFRCGGKLVSCAPGTVLTL